MAFYLYQVTYNAAASKAMIDHPHSREDAARKAAESLGGKLHAFYFAFGAFDAVLICEFPDNVSAAACSMAVGSRGTLSRFETTVLMSTAESIEAMKKAKTISYAAPQ